MLRLDAAQALAGLVDGLVGVRPSVRITHQPDSTPCSGSASILAYRNEAPHCVREVD
jgi:hypothetical protein